MLAGKGMNSVQLVLVVYNLKNTMLW